MMGEMDRNVAIRAALLQGGSLVVLAVVLAIALPRSVFEDWGWAAGPGVWALCAAFAASVLRLPLAPALAGAALAGIPNLIGVLAGIHWIGAPLGIALFGLWCGRLAMTPAAA